MKAYAITEYAAADGPRLVTRIRTPIDRHLRITHLHESAREGRPDPGGGD